MALTAKLEMRQGQQLVMTPQLQQAIRLLQLSNLELVDFVEAELERNPLLEREEQTASTRSSDDGDGANTQGDGRDDGGDGGGDSGGDSGDDRWLDLKNPVADPAGGLDTDFGNVFQDSSGGDNAAMASGLGWAGVSQRMHNGPDDGGDLENFAIEAASLRDHLAQQLPLTIADAADRIIGQHLIDMVDDAGYINVDLASLADRLGTDEPRVEAVLLRLQTFDPPGIFARSLAECLALQLKELNRYDPMMESLLANLDLLASRNLNALRRAVNADMDELIEMIQEIKALDPKPGLRFGSVQMQPVVPDVVVRPAQDGGWHVELNSETLPRVLVNRTYYTRISNTSVSDKDKGYLFECLQTANWLVKSLDQRARTILKVAEQIVRQQDGFFMYGVQHLRPLNLKMIADAVSMHESTISRVTSNKYIATPRGIFELKYFFTSAIASADDGEAHSSESVRHRIKLMIDAEAADDVLSDDQIVDKLKADGIEIARRTVAKYREALRIPSSVQRRREKRNLARLSPDARAVLQN